MGDMKWMQHLLNETLRLMKLGRLGGFWVGMQGVRCRGLHNAVYLFFVNCISRVVKVHLSDLARCISQMRVGWVAGGHAGG